MNVLLRYDHVCSWPLPTIEDHYGTKPHLPLLTNLAERIRTDEGNSPLYQRVAAVVRRVQYGMVGFDRAISKSSNQFITPHIHRSILFSPCNEDLLSLRVRRLFWSILIPFSKPNPQINPNEEEELRVFNDWISTLTKEQIDQGFSQIRTRTLQRLFIWARKHSHWGILQAITVSAPFEKFSSEPSSNLRDALKSITSEKDFETLVVCICKSPRFKNIPLNRVSYSSPKPPYIKTQLSDRRIEALPLLVREAFQQNHRHKAKLLSNVLITAASAGHRGVMQTLFDEFLDFITEPTLSLVLKYASIYQNVDLVGWLLTHKALYTISRCKIGPDQMSATLVETLCYKRPVSKLLIEAMLNFSYFSKSNRDYLKQMLFFAAKWNRDILELIIWAFTEHGCFKKIPPENFLVALQAAEEQGYADILINDVLNKRPDLGFAFR